MGKYGVLVDLIAKQLNESNLMDTVGENVVDPKDTRDF